MAKVVVETGAANLRRAITSQDFDCSPYDHVTRWPIVWPPMVCLPWPLDDLGRQASPRVYN
uniref:Uncharacterized protein n=1 Tax=Oryza barthii TaxID=65489 RepID=A0A0D3EP35_9ORYZ